MSILLEAKKISKYFGDRKIFAFKHLTVHTGDKIGVVGINGSGKTTLFNILAGLTESDSGTVQRNCKISYLQQFGQAEPAAAFQRLGAYQVSDKLHEEGLSGGEQTRLKIASALDQSNILVFADEPTANLDTQGIALVTKDLQQAESVLLISHDRQLLDTVCNKIIAIEDQELVFYPGNLSTYLTQRQRKQDFAQFEYTQYVEEKKRLEESVQRIKQKASSMKKAPKRMGNSEARLHRGSIKERQQKAHQSSRAIEARLKNMEIKEQPPKERKVILDFSLTNPPQNQVVVKGQALSFAYPGKPALFREAMFSIPNRSKTCLYGGNGCGKTTLLNRIAQGAEGITLAPKAKFGYFYQGFENLDLGRTVLENALEGSVQSVTTVRTILARLLFQRGDMDKPAAALSGGERVKLSLAKLFVSEANVLLLDEPTNYLDISAIEELQEMLVDYPGTVVLVSHDRTLVRAVANRLILFENQKLVTFEGNLAAYEESQKQEKSTKEQTLEKTVLEMRIAELTSRLASNTGLKKEAKALLEAEYQEAVCQLQQYQCKH